MPTRLFLVLSACALPALLSVPGEVRSAEGTAEVSGERRIWHRIAVTVEGPATDESASPNPFLDFRLDVTCRQGANVKRIPGFYAADGRAAETGATGGRKWRAFFLPDAEGRWEYEAVLLQGPEAAIRDEPVGDVLVRCAGEITVKPTDKEGRDHRAKGALLYAGKHYLQFAGTGDFFLKGGADSPENFLAYRDFDGTYDSAALEREGEARGGRFIHAYEPHVRDWNEGDPTWRGGRGKGIIGALNYLASKGMNSVYFLTMNVGGDGKDVWPWTTHEERWRFDCSKLDQWEIVFSHMDRLGILLHVVMQETENDQLLDGGDLGPQRRLYYRELVARFAHHPALVWNLGEENTNTDAQRKEFARHIHRLDSCDHPVVVHTYPGKYDEVYTPLLGYPYLEGPSLQTNDSHEQTIRWVDRSAAAGRPWVVCLDEIGPAHTGVKPDTRVGTGPEWDGADVLDPGHDEVRSRHLWGHLMAGGAGVEWYFGYRFPHNDLNCEDWRSRDRLWDMTRHALEFFHGHLPFPRMSHHDALLSGEEGYCFASPGEIYAVYLSEARNAKLDLKDASGDFQVRWYDPRTGGSLQEGSTAEIRGPGPTRLGTPPSGVDRDWVALIRSNRLDEGKSP